ncbi:MAG: phage head closure protein [Pseudomonadota bacterium]
MIGRLRHQITFLARIRTADPGGGFAVTWEATATVWANVERLASASSASGAGSPRERRLKRIGATIRARSGLSLGSRIRYRGTDYEITSVEDADERGLKLLLVGEEAI